MFSTGILEDVVVLVLATDVLEGLMLPVLCTRKGLVVSLLRNDVCAGCVVMLPTSVADGFLTIIVFVF